MLTVIIAAAHLRPRRKFRISLEALFMIDFPAARNKFSFYLDRKGKRVTIDINANAKTFSKQLDVPMLNETTTIRSLALSFSQNVITLYIDCKDVLKDEIEFNLSKLYLDMEEPTVKLFRERKYPLYLDGSVESALDRASCQKLVKRKPNRNIVRDLLISIKRFKTGNSLACLARNRRM
jgi:thrombospondin 2/3/4/5